MAIFHKHRGAFSAHPKRHNGHVATPLPVLNKCLAPVNGFWSQLSQFAIYPVLAAVYRSGTAPVSNGAACSEAAGLLPMHYPTVVVQQHHELAFQRAAVGGNHH